MTFRKALFAAMIATAMLGGCKRAGDIVIEQGVGITAIRSVCSAVGVPDYTGNMTLFSPANARTQPSSGSACRISPSVQPTACPAASANASRSPRALATNAPLIVADEPTANLDEASAIKVAELLEDVARNGHVVAMGSEKSIANANRERNGFLNVSKVL